MALFKKSHYSKNGRFQRVEERVRTTRRHMTLTKQRLSALKQPALSTINQHLVDYPTPSNLSYLWGFGSLAGICLVIQIITGIFLAMHYTPHIEFAFNSVEHIMRDVQGGWLIRYIHANGASMFFIVVYLHIFRGIYYASYSSPREFVWCIGVLIFLLMIITAFIGYVLPWGQMSFWGATVITSLASAIPVVGDSIVSWLWGGFSVDNATLNRFFSLHYLLPFVIVGASLLHLAALHQYGSNNPLGINPEMDKIPFYPYFYVKDLVGWVLFAIFFAFWVFYAPNVLGHPDNYIPANPMSTPPHIVPEWYFLPIYAILRSIPDKAAGVAAIALVFICLLSLPFVSGYVRSSSFRPVYQGLFFLLLADCFLLGWIGCQPVEAPFVTIGQVASVVFFLFFLLTALLGRAPKLTAFCDAAEPWQVGFQDPATPMMQGIVDLHHDIFLFLIIILVFVLWVLARALWHFGQKRNSLPQRVVHGTTIEILWTIFPSLILMFIAIPSFALLYSMDEIVVNPAITIKAIGHQWYWTYEYSDYMSSDEDSLLFDSYMLSEDDLSSGALRLLEVDNRVVVPESSHIRMIVTSADVLHSWAMPSLGVKCDAVPGRLNQLTTFIDREGVFYGQCSEICGTNHGFMPIVVESVSREGYASWVSNQLLG